MCCQAKNTKTTPHKRALAQITIGPPRVPRQDQNCNNPTLSNVGWRRRKLSVCFTVLGVSSFVCIFIVLDIAHMTNERVAGRLPWVPVAALAVSSARCPCCGVHAPDPTCTAQPCAVFRPTSRRQAGAEPVQGSHSWRAQCAATRPEPVGRTWRWHHF